MKKMSKFFDWFVSFFDWYVSLPLWGWIGRSLRRLLIPILYLRNDRNIFVPPFTEEELGVTAFDKVGCGSRGRIVAKIGGGHK